MSDGDNPRVSVVDRWVLDDGTRLQLSKEEYTDGKLVQTYYFWTRESDKTNHSPRNDIPTVLMVSYSQGLPIRTIMSFTDRENHAHRDNDLPAQLVSGSKKRIYRWFKNGIPHREHGPQEIIARNRGMECFYRVNGNRFSREMFVTWYEMTFLKEYKGL